MSQWSRRGLLLLPVVFSATVYLPLVRNFFFADDFLNLYHIANQPLLEYLLRPNGGHVLFLRNGFFYVFFRAFETDASLYFWAVLATHLVNVALLFRVVELFTGSSRLAVFGATLWGTSILNEGALGWYSVYGHVLVGTFLLAILARAARLANLGVLPRTTEQALWCGLALAAVTCFGVGISLAMVLPVVLTLISPNGRGAPTLTYVLWIAVPALYVGLLWCFQTISEESLPYASFLGEHILPYLSSMLPLLFGLVSYGATRLSLGFFYSPAGFPMAVSTIVAAMFASLVAWSAWRSNRALRLRIAAAVALVVGAYGMIAIGRVAFLSMTSFDSIVVMSRYHYAGLLALTLLLCTALAGLCRRPPKGRWPNLLLATWLAAHLGAFLVARPELDHHEMARAETEKALQYLRKQIAARPAGAGVYIRNRAFPPLPPIVIKHTKFPGLAAVFVIYYPDNTVDGRRVRFVERNPDVIEAANSGRRTKDLLVSAAAAPGARHGRERQSQR